MPQPITVYPADIIGLKSEETDIIHDYVKMCDFLLKKMDGKLTEHSLEIIQANRDRCKPLMSPLRHQNRVYVTTNLDFVTLMMVDIEKGILDHLQFTLDIIGPLQAWDEVDFELLSACVWIFEGEELIFRSLVTSKTLCKLMVVFDKENLVDYNSSRYDWKTKHRTKKPRSKGKSFLEEDESADPI
ncbi:hypothetical protein [Paenibacillus tyrfis]|uniref:Uncharacterized protein n=1 Tax=Paenibacillus tyrfis TaxID=1501230 RepID=A0A081NY88_9BACL|nr:hypothetical protein [Paenibacillus tyrfis]KEQ23411.1 hypothetical protein ET33_16395 [Paenibacillus tyrfis]